MAVSAEPLAMSDRKSSTSSSMPAVARQSHSRSEAFDILLFTSYGLLNNGMICVVYGAAQDIVKTFGYKNSAPLVTLISTMSSIVAPLLLLAWPLNITGYRVRAAFSCIFGVCGLLLLVLSTQAMANSFFGMGVGMFGVFFVGLQQGIGENCACMRFRRFSKNALSCWGAGTGLAGIFPPMIYGAISHLPLHVRFLVVIPLLAVYFGICIMVYNAGQAAKERDALRSLIEDGVQVAPTREFSQPDVQAELEAAAAENGSEQQGASTSWFAWYVIGVFSGVYALEYFIFPTLVDRATQCKPTDPLGAQAYNNSWIMYNVGVTLSRGSIAFFEFPCLWLVVVLQAVNVFGWAVDVKTQFLSALKGPGYIVQYIWMVWVGLMGGTAYANCIRKFNSSPHIPNGKRDKYINLAFAVSMATMMASTALGTLLDNTVLTNEIVTRNCPQP